MSATTLNITSATMAQLVAFFNANTGGNQVKKFADRVTAERRVQKLIDEMAEEIGFGDKLEEDENNGKDFIEYMSTPEPEAVYTDEKTGVDFLAAPMETSFTRIKLTESVDARDGRLADLRKLDRANAKGPRPEMVASLKIDRRIVDLLTGEEYANACQVWKAGLVSSAQGDRLSAVLYGAFKKTGKRDAICKVNGHSFRLAYL